MLELGLEELLKTVNRDIYPENEYKYGQWDYQVVYEEMPEKVTKQFDDNVEKATKLLYSKGNPATFGKPARTSDVTKDGGWFGGKTGAELMDIPLEYTVFRKGSLEGVYKVVVDGLKKNGYWGATAYYRNHKANREYNLKAKDGAKLDMPVLFIDARYDGVCASNDDLKKSGFNVMTPMRELCSNYTETSIEAGHWVAMEKYEETNAAIAGWLLKQVPGWPGPKEIKL